MLGSQAVPTASCKPWSWEAARSSTQKQWLPGGRPRPGLPWADTSVLNLQEEKKPTSPAEALVSHVPGRCTASLIGISFHQQTRSQCPHCVERWGAPREYILRGQPVEGWGPAPVPPQEPRLWRPQVALRRSRVGSGAEPAVALHLEEHREPQRVQELRSNRDTCAFGKVIPETPWGGGSGGD